MKVLFVASSTYMPGGATKSLLSMLSQLQAHGVEFEMICPDDKGLTQWLSQQGIKVHVIRFVHARLPVLNNVSDFFKWGPRFLYYSWINLRGKSAMKRIVRESNPDLIHENSSVTNLGYHSSRWFGVPDIIHIREYGDLDFGMKLPGRKKRLRAPHVFTIPITKDISRHLNQDTNPRSLQIYDGIVKASDFRLNENKERWFLFAGRIESGKGIEDLLEAYVDYASNTLNPYPLYILGSGVPAYVEKLKLLVLENSLQDHVKWYGEREDVADFMAKTIATVIPSRNEGLGRVMPEAMANGSLCISRNKGGTKEQLDNGKLFTGAPIAISYETKEQLVEALLYVSDAVRRGNAFSSGSEFHQMIERSQTAVREFFSEERFGEKLIAFYDKILCREK